jgi:hypothetical protein
MSLQYRTDAVMRTTVGSAYRAGDPTLTVAAGEGNARMPATGDFWVRIEPTDGSWDGFIRKVTSRSGDVLTFAAGTDQGTIDHDAPVGCLVYWVLSAGALTQLKADLATGTTTPDPATYAAMILAESGLVNYYRFEDALGSGTLADSVGGNTGTVTGAVTFQTDSRIGKCAEFSGGYISIPRPVQDDFSIEIWMKPNGCPDAGVAWWEGWGVVNGEVSGYTNDYGIAIVRSGLVTAGVHDDLSLRGGFVADGKWHHVVFTRQRSTGIVRLYVDAEEVSNKVGNTNSLTKPATLGIGARPSGAGPFYGLLDELAIYNVVLTPSQILNHFNAGGRN